VNRIQRKQLRGLVKGMIGRLHRQALRMGVVVVPNHYYTPIADVNELQRSRASWAKRSAMPGVEMDAVVQARTLVDMIKPFEPEFRGNAAYREGASKGFGPGFGYVEAQCLHGVLRALKPRRIVEVGSGVSTNCVLSATALNEREGHHTQITCIEPNPSSFLQSISGVSKIELLKTPVQALDPEYFLELEEGDFLFVDSTHAIKPGGDVIYLYLEVIPRLKPGVIVHLHDIYLPYLYQRDLLQPRTLFQWSETAMLLALLVGNPRLSIIFCLSLLHYDAPAVLSDVFPEYRPEPAREGLCEPGAEGHFPSSIYIRTR
jgi:predicted O-methyltransferase YrrM